MRLTVKQAEYIQKATHRWNFKVGATRAGKSFIDSFYIIPQRILERRGQDGLSVIMGVTRETIERNVLLPMRGKYGSAVGDINSRNIARIMGEDVYCLGAEKINQLSKIQGAEFKYLYGDEVAKWNEEVFNFAKSRLSSRVSCFDGTLNPESPNHYTKKFIDSDADIYCQHYTIDDNPFLDPFFVEQLKKEYFGTIYYDRYILGLWKRAEGAIYRLFADKPERYAVPRNEQGTEIIPQLIEINAAIDFGGTQSKHSFTASGITPGYLRLVALKSERHEAEGTMPTDIDRLAVEFVGAVIGKYGRCDYLYWDNEAPVLGRGIKNAVERVFPQVTVRPCQKKPIKDRIDLMVRLLGSDRFLYAEDCEPLKEALEQAIYDSKHDGVRLDDGTSDIDTLDSFEYTWTPQIKRFIQ